MRKKKRFIAIGIKSAISFGKSPKQWGIWDRPKNEWVKNENTHLELVFTDKQIAKNKATELEMKNEGGVRKMKCPCCDNRIEEIVVVQHQVLKIPLKGKLDQVSRREIEKGLSLDNLVIQCPVCDLNLSDEIELVE